MASTNACVWTRVRNPWSRYLRFIITGFASLKLWRATIFKPIVCATGFEEIAIESTSFSLTKSNDQITKIK